MYNLCQVSQMPYPLRLKPMGKFRYFQKREEWKVTDVLFNPMVMMMLLPLLLVTILPKMMQVCYKLLNFFYNFLVSFFLMILSS